MCFVYSQLLQSVKCTQEVLLRRNGSKSCGDVLMKDIKDRKLQANFAYSLSSHQLTNCNMYNIKTN